MDYVEDIQTDIYTRAEYRRSICGRLIRHSIVIRNCAVKSLAPATRARGTIGISDCLIETMSPLTEVDGDVWCSFHYRHPQLKTLGSLRRIGGNARFRYTPLEDLGNLEFVGGDLSLRDTQISSLGKLSHVGGNLYLPKRVKGIIDTSSVFVGGEIRYWNDAKTKPYDNASDIGDSICQKSDITVPYWPQKYLYYDFDISFEPKAIRDFYNYFKQRYEEGVLLDLKGNTNYAYVLLHDLKRQYTNPYELSRKYELLMKGYPQIKGWCQANIVDTYKENGQDEGAWHILKNSEAISVNTVRYYVEKLGNDIFDGEIAAKICGIGCLTPFGQSHFSNIAQFFKRSLTAFENKYGSSFFDLFFDRGLSYKTENGEYNADYYKQFYIVDKGVFYHYKELDNNEYHREHKLVVEHAILEQLRGLLLDAEDLYRESVGIAKIGEGWVCETTLYYEIKEAFKDYNVVQHGHPRWLGKQHIDIYFPDLKIGIEYQGIQHYEAVDYFGGEEGLARTKERDERKRQLCQKNSCPLIYVNEGYVFDDVVKEIETAIERKRKERKLKSTKS